MVENYFGLRLEVTDELDPEHIIQLREDAWRILNLYCFNPDEFFVYCHLLLIYPMKNHFCSNIPIENRINSLKILFHVNQKQRKYGSIKFYNWKFDETPVERLMGFSFDDNIATIHRTFDLEYNVKSDFISRTNCFKNAMVTFVNKNLRPSFRKIKVEVIPEATDSFKGIIRSDISNCKTYLDVFYKEHIALLAPPEYTIIPGGNKQPYVLLSKLDRERMHDLDKILDIYHEKLIQFNNRIASNTKIETAAELKEIKSNILPKMRMYEKEYSDIIASKLSPDFINDIDANECINILSILIRDYKANAGMGQSSVLSRQLEEVLSKLEDPGKSARAKLKVTLPIIPLLVSCDLELDTEAFITNIWINFRNYIRRLII